MLDLWEQQHQRSVRKDELPGQISVWNEVFKLNTYLILYIEINFNWIIELNMKSKSIKLLEETKRELPFNVGVQKDLFI